MSFFHICQSITKPVPGFPFLAAASAGMKWPVTRLYLSWIDIATTKIRGGPISVTDLLTNTDSEPLSLETGVMHTHEKNRETPMKLVFYLMRSILYVRYFFHKFTATGSFGRHQARYETGLPTIEGNPVKAGLFRHHVRQFHESSCSVASVACVVNTLLESQGRMPKRPVTQQDLLDRVSAAHWKERMGPDGYRGRRGLPLPVLGQVVEASLRVFNIVHQGVEVVPATRAPDKTGVFCRTLRRRLARFERTGDGIIIAHFDQGSLVQDLNIPHISPVGGFDPDTGEVTILDVDTSQIYPYTVPFNRFYRAISTNYLHLFHLFGYGRGGYIYIKI
jgi:hypothetical protein